MTRRKQSLKERVLNCNVPSKNSKAQKNLAHKAENFPKSAAFLNTQSPPSWHATQESESAKIITFPIYTAKHLQDKKKKKDDIQFSSEKVQAFPADALSEIKTLWLKR